MTASSLTARSRRRRSGQTRGPAVVIGAGPYGLAVAAHLRGAGVVTRCFGEPLEFWRGQMPEGMLLRSRDRSSNIADPQRALTIAGYEQAVGRSVHRPHLRLEEFIDYGLWFQRQAVPDVDRRRVTTVAPQDGGFQIELADGETFTAGRVIVAAGLSPFPYRPHAFAKLPQSLVSHSAEHPDLGVFAGKRVIVIGAGQSALESAVLLGERGASVELLARAPAVRWLASEDGDRAADRPRIAIPPPPTDVGGRFTGWMAAAPDAFRRAPKSAQAWIAARCVRPAGAGWLRPRLGEVEISCGRYAAQAEPIQDQVRLTLDDDSERLADHVLLGTGYQIDVLRYPFLGPAVAGGIKLLGGYPLLGPGLESSVPGLHFVGAPAALSFGPINRFVVGTWYTAPALTRRVLGRAQPPISFSF